MVGIKDTNDGTILENTGELYSEIASEYSSRNYTQFCNQLGVKHAKSDAILTQRLSDYERAVTDVLNIWERKGNATRAKLESALEKAETGALCSIVKKHFAKDAVDEEEESSEGAPSGSRPKRQRSAPSGSRPKRQRKKKKKILGGDTDWLVAAGLERLFAAERQIFERQIFERHRLEQRQLQLQLHDAGWPELLLELTESLKKRYTHSDRFSDDILLRKRDFRPTLKRRDGSGRSLYAMENSRHDIFASSTASQQPRRKLVSSNNTADKTGLCHSMAYDWATQNSASTLSEMGYLFEISASQIKKDQTIEGAIKDQLFSDLEEVDEGMIGQLLEDMPDVITILVDGYDVGGLQKYGKNIMGVLTGCALQEVNIMVTTLPRYVANLTRLASGVYDRIVMQDTSAAGEKCAVETTKVERSTRMVEAHLERLYTDPKRFLEGIALRKRDFQPTLKRRDGSSKSGCAMENSRHDIFASSTASQQPRRIVVSGNNAADNTGLCHSLSDDWVTENSSSTLSEVQYLLQISASRIRENQTIEGAIKDQLFSDLHEIDEDKVRQILKDMPDEITILFDGFDFKHIRTYGDNIRNVLTGCALPEVTVVVTARPRSANQLHRLAPNLYDHIIMQ